MGALDAFDPWLERDGMNWMERIPRRRQMMRTLRAAERGGGNIGRDFRTSIFCQGEEEDQICGERFLIVTSISASLNPQDRT